MVGSKFICFYNLQRTFLLYLQLVVRRQKERKDKGGRKRGREEGKKGERENRRAVKSKIMTFPFWNSL